jgi:hypothetical protein
VTNGFHSQPVVHTPLGSNTGFAPANHVTHTPLGSNTGTSVTHTSPLGSVTGTSGGHGHRR